jgi:hypothetical protein
MSILCLLRLQERCIPAFHKHLLSLNFSLSRLWIVQNQLVWHGHLCQVGCFMVLDLDKWFFSNGGTRGPRQFKRHKIGQCLKWKVYFFSKGKKVLPKSNINYSGHQVNNKMDFIFCLKGVMQLNNKRMIHSSQNVSFGKGVQNLLSFDNKILFNDFHGIKLPILRVLDHKDLSICSIAQIPDKLKVTYMPLRLCF